MLKNDNEEKENNEEKNSEVKNYKTIENNDLFILFSRKNSEDLFLGKIKEGCSIKRLIIGKINYKSPKINNCDEERGKIKKWLKNKKSDYKSSSISIDKNQDFEIKDVRCNCEEKKYYIEAYKLHAKIGEVRLDEVEHITIKKLNNNKESIDFYYGNITNNKIFSFKLKDEKELNFYTDNNFNNDGLEYFFNGASISEEDMISLGLIAQLNKGKIFIGNKKAEHGELADIIGFKEDNGNVIIHLLHIKTSPFIKNGSIESYSYYTTAIGQMLQKIEPILIDSSKNIDFLQKFFKNSITLEEIEDKICKFINKIKEKDKCSDYDLVKELKLKEKIKLFKVKENFLTKVKNSKKIELRIGVAILETQFKGKINNKVFYMIKNILLNGFEHTIKPFLGNKEIDIVFYPIIIENN